MVSLLWLTALMVLVAWALGSAAGVGGGWIHSLLAVVAVLFVLMVSRGAASRSTSV